MKITTRVLVGISCAILLASVGLSIRRATKEIVAPCTVTIHDELGRPLQKVLVTEQWDYYSYDLSGGSEIYTDARGQAVFPPQFATRSALFWLVGPALTQLRYGAHASSGIMATIGATGLDATMTNSNNVGASCVNSECLIRPLIFQWTLRSR